MTTEKDAVKLAGRTPLPLVTVRLAVEVAEPGFFAFLAARLPAAGPRRSMSAKSRSPARDRFELVSFRVGAGLLALLPRGAAERLGRRPDADLRAHRAVAARDPRREPASGASRKERCGDRAAGRGFRGLGRRGLRRVPAGLAACRKPTSATASGSPGEEHLHAARARGHGVFLLSAHFGGWELGAIRAGLIGEPISPVVRPLDNPHLEEELARRRTRFGNRLIAKRDAARDILRAIRNRETVAILVDQNVLAQEAVFVPFFGRLAATTPALALFQLKTDAAVVPAFVRPEGGGRYVLELGTPILAEEFRAPGRERDEAVRRATARYMEVTEEVIRTKPEAWLWMHNRWRTRPEGEAS